MGSAQVPFGRLLRQAIKTLPYLKTTVQSASWLCLCALILAIAVARFVGLERSPPGIYCDEAIFAGHAIYFSQTGHDIYGTIPFFVPSGGGGTISPVNLYPKALWVKVFGYSISAVRAYPCIIATLMLAGLFLLARQIMDHRAAVYALLAASLSPWIFHFSRSTIDDYMLYICGLVWGCFFFLRSTQAKDAILAAAAFSLAAYGYFSARAVLPLLFPALLWLKSRGHPQWRRHLTLFFAVGTVLCLPIVWLTLNGLLMARGADVSIFSPGYRHFAGLDTVWSVLATFLRNVLLHFDPKYLFVSGDGNLRHSTQFTGELTWLDDFGLVVGVAWLGSSVLRNRRLGFDPVLVFCLIGVVVGILPAAMSWEGIPHSARSAGSWPFVALMTGWILRTAERRWPAVLPAACAISVCFSAGFLWHYFTVYPGRARPWYYADFTDAARDAKKAGDWRRFNEMADALQATEGWDPGAVAYFRIAYEGKSAVDAFQFPPWMIREISPAAMYANMGRVCLRKGDGFNAAADFEAALKRNPDLVPAQLGLGEAFLQAGQLPEAIGQFQGTIRIHPDLLDPQINLCNALVQAGQIGPALDWLRRMDGPLQASSEGMPARCQLALTLLAARQTGEATRLLEQVLHIRPHQPDAHFLLGLALRQEDRMADANVQFRLWQQYRRNPDATLDISDRILLSARMHALGLLH